MFNLSSPRYRRVVLVLSVLRRTKPNAVAIVSCVIVYQARNFCHFKSLTLGRHRSLDYVLRFEVKLSVKMFLVSVGDALAE